MLNFKRNARSGILYRNSNTVFVDEGGDLDLAQRFVLICLDGMGRVHQ